MRILLEVDETFSYTGIIVLTGPAELGSAELSISLSPFDLRRLDSYANNQLDYHVIMDLLPTIAQLYFEKRVGSEVHLSAVQSSILLALGLQRKTVEEIEVRLPFLVPVLLTGIRAQT